MSAARLSRQQGLSMIELLIALAISSFLILGVTQIFIDNKRNYLFQRSQTSIHENARYAEMLLNDYLAKAGYRRAPDELPEYAFPALGASTDCLAFTKGSPVTATADQQGICIRYQPLVSGESDCIGNATGVFNDDIPFTSPPQSALVILAIKYDQGDALDSGTITCKNISSSVGEEALLGNVADFRLEFGVGTNDLLSKALITTGDRFVSASDWTTNSGPIRAVRYSLLLASAPNQREGGSQVYTDWLASAGDTSKIRLEAGDQNRLYQVAGSTRTIRNLMP
ncbi:prepilin-type N-terminal cleavage/methylation domain-containing protein [Halopseudomonas pelagia]|uniref:prepilin-type N-terminal cleavage/methylation domain-containing protein n=1 Tax=Halopseudomonas pelagia TaxID=553151 RepID=UPI0030D775F6|tara:strand:+ start:1603 stop:2451 length:849 start_codon:yes stop_codon:yes gene_type:complete